MTIKIIAFIFLFNFVSSDITTYDDDNSSINVGGQYTEPVLTRTVDPIEYLRKFGYLNDNETTHQLEKENYFREALIAFQESFGLTASGEMNDETQKLMQQPRCGNVDNLEYFSVIPNGKWKHNTISWYFYTSVINRIPAEKAFALWAKHANLTFVRSRYNPNISISLGNTKHMYSQSNNECVNEFDDKGGILAHAFMPNIKTNKVEIHIDETENWQYKMELPKPNEVSLFLVLVHEIGHALGLKHSTQYPNCVMYPTYNKPESLTSLDDYDLHKDDIKGIQYLYGKKHIDEPTTTTTTTTTITPTITYKPTVTDEYKPKPYELCELEGKLSTFLIVSKTIYVFYEYYVWEIAFSDATREKVSNPKYIKHYLPFLADNFKGVKAVYQRPDKSIVLFDNFNMYNFIFPNVKLLKKQSIKDFLGNNAIFVNAIFSTYTGQSFLIYNNQFLVKINECDFTTSLYGYVSTKFIGLPTRITGVFRYTNGKLYFFTENGYVYEYNEFEETVERITQNQVFNMLNIVCSKRTILNQLKNLLDKLYENSMAQNTCIDNSRC